MSGEGKLGMGAAGAAALWRAAGELVAWAELVAVSGERGRFAMARPAVNGKSRARKARKARAA